MTIASQISSGTTDAAVKWKRGVIYSTSACGRYAIRSGYFDGRFAHRAKFVPTDEIVAESHDRAFVEQRCDSHAAAIDSEVPA